MSKRYPWNVLPEAFLARVDEITPTEKRDAVLQSFCISKPPTFRANTLKISSDDLATELKARDIPFLRIPWYTNAFVLDGLPQKILTETDLYKDGKLYVQNLSSMIPALILDPKPGDTILDLTAAPGSKTTQMAAMMNNVGEIVANDRSRVRIYRLEANLKMQGVSIAHVKNTPGEIIWQTYPEHFDKTLVDVPCSLEGTFLCSNPKSFENWTPKKVKVLAKMQKFLLRSAVSATKPGGVIVYSTCTLEPEENELIIDWILKKEKGKVIAEFIPCLAGRQARFFPEMMEGLTSWKEKSLDPSITNTRRILPSATMEGFFVAKLRKTASTIPANL